MRCGWNGVCLHYRLVDTVLSTTPPPSQSMLKLVPPVTEPYYCWRQCGMKATFVPTITVAVAVLLAYRCEYHCGDG
jgi:hypothetical protein